MMSERKREYFIYFLVLWTHTDPIPGVFTYKLKGDELASIVDNGTSVTMYITIGETRAPYNGINR